MIKTFKDRDTERVFQREYSRRFDAIKRQALMKLNVLHYATELADLRVPPGNKLESLKGDRLGQHSIRINDQWRVCFVWKDGNAWDVEIVDYH